MNNLDSLSVKTRLISVGLFAIAMGLLEAICVVYLRQILLPPDGSLNNIAFSNFDFTIEVIREITTLVILLTIAILAAYNWRTRLAMFFLAFGIWDIFYYIGLKIFLDWPATILEWDALFLVPVNWYGPVLAPVLISVYFIIVSIIIVLREATGKKLHITKPAILLQLLTFVVWYYSFTKDSSLISEFGYESATYSWLLFVLGIIFCSVGIFITFRNNSKSH